MTKEILNVGIRRRRSEVMNDEIDAAADAYVANLKVAPFRFPSGHGVDVDAEVHAYPPAVAVEAEPERTPKFKWTMVRTAITLAHPVKR